MVAMEYNLYKFCLQIMSIIVNISLLALQIYPKHSIKNAKKSDDIKRIFVGSYFFNIISQDTDKFLFLFNFLLLFHYDI